MKGSAQRGPVEGVARESLPMFARSETRPLTIWRRETPVWGKVE